MQEQRLPHTIHVHALQSDRHAATTSTGGAGACLTQEYAVNKPTQNTRKGQMDKREAVTLQVGLETLVKGNGWNYDSRGESR